VIAVAIWADDAAMQDGIATLIQDAPGVEIVGVAEDEFALVRLLEAVRVDVAVVASESDTTRDFMDGLADEVAAILLVTDGAGVAAAVRAGARAVLLRPPDRAELTAAIQAVAAGLSVLPASLLDDMLRLGGVDRAASNTEALTPRELEVLALIAAGASNKLIARRLAISVHTAKFHVAGVLEKLGAHSRSEAVAIGARVGLVLL
jgi:two-component system, NarL family, response regulator YdfI